VVSNSSSDPTSRERADRTLFAAIGLGEASIPVPVFSDDEWRDLTSLLSLSSRELDIIRAVTAEKKDATIALQLGISARTVRTHFERLYRKLGVTNRPGLLLVLFRTIRQCQDHANGASSIKLKRE
jgi:DNA-binding NarL/FixJ family response regulator